MELASKEKLEKMAPILRSLDEDPHAVMRYCNLSDAVFWSDEVPSGADWSSQYTTLMRILFHYRTTLILGNPEQRFQEVFAEGKRLFPEWIGFVDKRMQATDQFIQFYESSKKRSQAFLKGAM